MKCDACGVNPAFVNKPAYRDKPSVFLCAECFGSAEALQRAWRNRGWECEPYKIVHHDKANRFAMGTECPLCKAGGLFDISRESGGALFYRCEECLTYFDAWKRPVSVFVVPGYLSLKDLSRGRQAGLVCLLLWGKIRAAWGDCCSLRSFLPVGLLISMSTLRRTRAALGSFRRDLWEVVRGKGG